MRLTELAHNYLRAQLQPGDYAIDATSGNGHDTLHMAKLVGTTGHVIAVDIQEAAIAATRHRLKTENQLKQVRLFLDDHSKVFQSLFTNQPQIFSAITFNLGYLPGSDKQIQTKPNTTIEALGYTRELLKHDGLLLVTAYRGHSGGQVEADFVAQWMHHLPSNSWQVEVHDPVATDNKEQPPPILWSVRKLHVELKEVRIQ